MDDEPILILSWLRICWLDIFALGIAFNEDGIAVFLGPISIFLGSTQE